MCARVRGRGTIINKQQNFEKAIGLAYFNRNKGKNIYKNLIMAHGK
jgi:hypothetical protein